MQNDQKDPQGPNHTPMKNSPLNPENSGIDNTLSQLNKVNEKTNKQLDISDKNKSDTREPLPKDKNTEDENNIENEKIEQYTTPFGDEDFQHDIS